MQIYMFTLSVMKSIHGRKINLSFLAAKTAIHRSFLSHYFSGRKLISARLAKKLGKITKTPKKLWIDRDFKALSEKIKMPKKKQTHVIRIQ